MKLPQPNRENICNLISSAALLHLPTFLSHFSVSLFPLQNNLPYKGYQVLKGFWLPPTYLLFCQSIWSLPAPFVIHLAPWNSCPSFIYALTWAVILPLFKFRIVIYLIQNSNTCSSLLAIPNPSLSGMMPFT